MAQNPRMLEGYRVLEFTNFVAGPTCGESSVRWAPMSSRSSARSKATTSGCSDW